MTREEAIRMAKADLKCMERDVSGRDEMCNSHKCDECNLNYERGNIGDQKEWLRMAINVLEQTTWIPCSEKYEHHTDHTDCIWYGNDSGCPVTCSQYRDGWNDAMDYIFKNGKGYQPYRHDGLTTGK